MDENKTQRTEAQIKQLEKLQDLLLADLITAFENGTATATDRATLIRFLKGEGWTLDPSRVPTSLKDKLTSNVRFDEDLSEDETGAPKLKLG